MRAIRPDQLGSQTERAVFKIIPNDFPEPRSTTGRDRHLRKPHHKIGATHAKVLIPYDESPPSIQHSKNKSHQRHYAQQPPIPLHSEFPMGAASKLAGDKFIVIEIIARQVQAVRRSILLPGFPRWLLLPRRASRARLSHPHLAVAKRTPVFQSPSHFFTPETNPTDPCSASPENLAWQAAR